MHPGSPTDGSGGGGSSSARTPSSERAMPAAMRGPAFDHVRDTWAEARRLREPELPSFIDALVALAHYARRNGLEVAELLKALDAVTRPESGGEPGLDWDHVREIAGRVVIRAYYRDD
jgi:hypothetical protein